MIPAIMKHKKPYVFEMRHRQMSLSLYCQNELAASELSASMLAASLLARQHCVLHVTALIMIPA